MKKQNLWISTNESLMLFFKSLGTKAFTKSSKALFYLPLILMVFLFSCKKEKAILPNEESQNIEQAKTEQARLESCGTSEQLKQQLITDPGFRSRVTEIEHSTQFNSNSAQRSSGLVTIPVVVHVVYNLPEQNISDQQIQSQIDVLTEDFTKTNADAAGIPSAFQSMAVNANIKFVLAKRDPNGNPTNGITRTSSSVAFFSSNNYVKFASYGGHDAWPTTQYLNIWVCNLGLCGYATYPGTTPTVDGVVVKYNCFGRTGILQTNYNKGRTATHEIMHWLNVYHIWGDATCGDDMVNDTPTQEKANYDHPVFPAHSSCSPNSNGDMFMNFMDYTSDGVRVMMTQGQVNRINTTLDGPRAGLLTSLGATSPGGGGGTACNVPSGLNTTLVTASNGTLNWLSSGAASYMVRYKPTTSSTWITTSNAATSFNLNSLIASTNYEFQVASVCSGGVTSAFSTSKAFTTLANAATCNIPAGLNVSAITANSSAINWISSGAASYKVRYKPTASSAWINTSSTSTALNLNSLVASTNYEYQVASVCSGTVTSAFSTSKIFTTLANATTCNIPAGLNVSSITANSSLTNWLSAGAASYKVRYKPTTSATWINTVAASTALNLTSLTASTNYEYQVASVCSGTVTSAFSTSKVFTTIANGNICNIPSGLGVSLITTNSCATNWLSTGAVTYNVRYKATTSATWITSSTSSTAFNLSSLMAFTNYEYQVASVCSGTGSAYSTSKVFTTLANATACNIPSGLNVFSITANNGSLNWLSSGVASYKVRYKPTTSSTWINTSSTSTALNLSSLVASTNYEYQVASVCSGTVTSAFSTSKVFTTLANAATACNIPSGLNASNVSKYNAQLNWSSTGAASYSVRYKSTQSPTWIYMTLSSTSMGIGGLNPSTTYEFQIAGKCSATTLSAYSASKLFTTTSVV